MDVTANNLRLSIAHIGKTVIMPCFSLSQVQLQDVNHMPKMKKNLFSMAQLTSSDSKERDGRFIALKIRTSKLSQTEGDDEEVDAQGSSSARDQRRRGVCCQYGKAHQLPCQESNYRAKISCPLELIHSDVFGLVKQQLIRSMRYMVTFIDNFSRSQLLLRVIIYNFAAGTPYANGVFHMKLILSHDFPQSPPKGYFMTKFFHPNIATNGEICVNALKKDWNSILGIRHVLIVIRCLLIEPFPESALNEQAGKTLLEKYEEYARHARLHRNTCSQAKVEVQNRRDLSVNYCPKCRTDKHLS
ncbi:Ubiquitin-protein ligase [Abeliophyllum distichum]|uniref:Ubiquitin-protein ligase n=1 Tax=Abeliophyllum distichum TaxID=126358 RepID=A0ABD1QY84_9LAMI